VTLITGARQVGKTTICKKISEECGYNYISLADIKERTLAIEDPEMFLKLHPSPLIIDEVQYAKGLFDSIESLVDKKKFETGSNEGMYILTGSQVYRMMEGVTQSMAGRVSIIEMAPLSLSEIIGRPEIPFEVDVSRSFERSKEYHMEIDEIYSKIIRGGYPELSEKPELGTAQFYADYVNTYITRDVSEIINIKDKGKFMVFMEILASLTGQELVLERISSVVGISKNTVDSWLSVLETGGIIHYLRPYSERSTVKRLVKRPKVYFSDTGLACYLSGMLDAKTLMNNYLAGPMVETYIVNEILKSYKNHREPAVFFFYRDSNDVEIDLMIQKNGKLSLIECKAGITYDKTDIKAFGRITHSDFEIGPSCLICLTDTAYPLTKEVYAIPLTSI